MKKEEKHIRPMPISARISHTRLYIPDHDYPGIFIGVDIEATSGHGMFATADEKEAARLCDCVNLYEQTWTKLRETERENEKLKQKIKKLRQIQKGAKK